jgi:hypothetical protein
MPNQKKCKHPSCNCMVAQEGTHENTHYCSTYCKDAKGTMEISCNCGHAGCAMTEGETVTSGTSNA